MAISPDRVESAANDEALGSFDIDLEQVNLDLRRKHGVQPLGSYLDFLSRFFGSDELALMQSAQGRRARHDEEAGLARLVAQRQLEDLYRREGVSKRLGHVHGMGSKAK